MVNPILIYTLLLIATSLAESSKSGVLSEGIVRALFQMFPTHVPNAPAHRCISGFVQELATTTGQD